MKAVQFFGIVALTLVSESAWAGSDWESSTVSVSCVLRDGANTVLAQKEGMTIGTGQTPVEILTDSLQARDKTQSYSLAISPMGVSPVTGAYESVELNLMVALGEGADAPAFVATTTLAKESESRKARLSLGGSGFSRFLVVECERK